MFRACQSLLQQVSAGEESFDPEGHDMAPRIMGGARSKVSSTIFLIKFLQFLTENSPP